MLLFIDWKVNPEIVNFDFAPSFLPESLQFHDVSIRWYGLLFALGFIVGQRILVHIFKKEGKPESDVDTLTLYMVLATVIGARVGHYVFYEFDSISSVGLGTWLWQMIKPPYSGLASHGAAVGIFSALAIYAFQKKDQHYLWVTDRMAITVAFAGFCIRMGNLMNSEIIGTETNKPWGFNFFYDREYLPTVPRHPAQLYEALSCLILFFIMMFIWNKYKSKLPLGSLTGLFMIWVFTLRFLYEFIKVNQVAFESNMAFKMGQYLSIPAILFGIIVMVWGRKLEKKAINNDL